MLLETYPLINVLGATYGGVIFVHDGDTSDEAYTNVINRIDPKNNVDILLVVLMMLFCTFIFASNLQPWTLVAS